MRVLLVYANPNQAVPVSPYGLEIIRGHLLARGTPVQVRIVNPFLEDLDPAARLRAVLAEFEPQLVGLSVRNLDNSVVVVSPEEPADGSPIDVVSYVSDIRQLVNAIQEWDPELPCVVGGAAFTSAGAEVLEYLGLDFGILGPGEESFRRLVTRLAVGGPPSRSRVASIMRTLPGAVCRDADDGGYRMVPLANVLRSEPAHTPAITPEYQVIYRLRGIPAAVRTKSGCPLRCAYCIDPVNMRRTDQRPIAHVLADIETYVDRYGLTLFHIADAELNLPYEDHVRSLCDRLVETGLSERIRWHGYFNATPCSDALLDGLVAAGCRTPSFAIDSFHDAGLRGHRKSFRMRHVHDLLDRLFARGGEALEPQICVLLGQPGETKASIDENIRWMLHYADRGAQVAYSCGLRVYAHTPLGQAELPTRHLYRHPGRPAPAADGRTVRLAAPDLVEPVVYCEPMPPRELAAYVAQRVAGHPRVGIFAEWPWPEASHRPALRHFNIGVHRLVHGRLGAAASHFEAALSRAPDLSAARVAQQLLGEVATPASTPANPRPVAAGPPGRLRPAR